MCNQILGGGHNIHYDINLEGTLGVKKNPISKKKSLGKVAHNQLCEIGTSGTVI